MSGKVEWQKMSSDKSIAEWSSLICHLLQVGGGRGDRSSNPGRGISSN